MGCVPRSPRPWLSIRETVFFRGIRPLPAERLRVRGRGLKPENEGRLPYEFLADTSLDQAEIKRSAQAPLVANAIGPVRIIPSDPASQGSWETHTGRAARAAQIPSFSRTELIKASRMYSGS